jgi:two-component system response regulator GlrR
VRVPPLREHEEDLPVLIAHFLRQLGREDFVLSAELRERFASYHWPGNVRELRNVIERVIAGVGLEPGELLQAEERTRDAGGGLLPFKEAKERLVDAFTREYLEQLLERCGGNISEASRVAGIARNHLHALIARLGLSPRGARGRKPGDGA